MRQDAATNRSRNSHRGARSRLRAASAWCALLAAFGLGSSQITAAERVPRAKPQAASAAQSKPAPDEQKPAVLELGNAIDRELSGGQSEGYLLTLAAGQCARLVVDQRGIDVGVDVVDPDGK